MDRAVRIRRIVDMHNAAGPGGDFAGRDQFAYFS
jgi:hypothetical protein